MTMDKLEAIAARRDAEDEAWRRGEQPPCPYGLFQVFCRGTRGHPHPHLFEAPDIEAIATRAVEAERRHNG